MGPGRAAEVQPEINFIMAREEEAGTLQRMREAGQLPLRVTHNDTKLNNVLLDKKNAQGPVRAGPGYRHARPLPV